MFVHKIFEFEDRKEQLAFMKRYSFATMITIKDNLPIATQLPFVIEERSGKVILSAHFALANEQAKYIESNTSLVIFSAPHAYISPEHYDNTQSAPTWDYISVHAYGRAKIESEEMKKTSALEKMISFYDEPYMEQWALLPERFKIGMIKGVVAFEIGTD